ncbi:hypothetical protein BDR07DRAFT_1380345 [Suillus spraguei]|nr:hypothetical protein BDR07DRAFT_1380345 [Suillus spraguei]
MSQSQCWNTWIAQLGSLTRLSNSAGTYPALSRPTPDTGTFRKSPNLVIEVHLAGFSRLCTPTPYTAAHCTLPPLLLQPSSHHPGQHYALQHPPIFPTQNPSASVVCCLSPRSTTLVPSTKSSLCPKNASCTNLLPTSSSLPTTALYNTCPSESCLADRTIQIHQRLVSSTHLRLQTRHSGIAPFNRLSTWILTCGSHHSDPPMPGVVYSPTPTDSTLGDRTIQPFVDLMSTFRPLDYTTAATIAIRQFEDTTAIALAILSVRHFLKCADYQQCLEGPRLRARGPHNHIIGST